MNLFSTRFLAGFAQLLTPALIHFVWQGAALALALLLVVKLLNLRTARIRYALSVCTLFAMGLAPLLTISLCQNIKVEKRRGLEAIERSNVVLHEPSRTLGIVDAISPQASAGPSNPQIEACVLMAWLAGVLILSTRLTIGFSVTLWLRAYLKPLPDEIEQRVRVVGDRLRVDARRRVFACAKVGQAVAVGFIRPVVLIPMAWFAQLTPELLEAVIAHELAHIRRWDLWVNLAQRVIETLLFYHPAVWWLSARIRLEREMCCDEMAARCFDRAMYARSLESVARISHGNLLMAASINGGTKMNLLHRVRNLLGAAPAETGSGWSSAAIILPVAAAVMFAVATWATSSVVMANADSVESESIKKIELLGGKITRDQSVPGSPVTEIDLQGSQKFNDKYAHLLLIFTNLRSLNLDDTRITAESLKEISKLTNLRELRLHATEITGEQLNEFQKSRPSTKVMIDNDEETKAIPMIERLGGRVNRDQSLLGHPVVGISFDLKNQWNDKVHDDDLHLLTTFKRLNSLNLNGTRITDEGLKHVALLKNLTSLQLDGDAITDEGFKEINELSNLASLSLFAVKISGAGLNDLGNLKNLSNLNLRRTKITNENLTGLRMLTGLRTLSLEETQVNDTGMEELTKLTNLTSLNVQKSLLDGNKITDAGLKNIRNLHRLTSLNVYCNQITDKGLKEISHLTNLTELFIHGPGITDAGLKELRTLTKLTTLDANEVAVTNDGLKEIGQMTGLTHIDLCYATVTDDGLKHLSGLKQLKSLALGWDKKITGVGFKDLAALDNLNGLFLYDTQISDDGIKEIGKLKNLQWINLGMTGLTDVQLQQLRELQNLTDLHLDENNITDAGLKEIAQFKKLKVLSVLKTKVTDEGVDALKKSLANLDVKR